MAKAFDRLGRVVAHDSKYTGEEPTWDDIDENDNSTFLRRRNAMLNFYNYYLCAKELKPFTLKWMKENGYTKEEISKVRRCAPTTPSPTVGKLCRANQLGMTLEHDDTNDLEFVKSEIKKAIHSTEALTDEDSNTNNSTTKKKVNPAQLVKDKVYETIIASLDSWAENELIDSENKPSCLKLFNMLKGHKTPLNGLGVVDNWIQTYLNEFKDALDGSCEQAKEANDHLTKTQLKSRIRAFEIYEKELEKYRATLKASRKPRVKKAPSLERQIKKLKYLQDCNENKIASVSPTTLPDSKESYFFNVKKNTLIYISSPGGLQIKGTTFVNFDEEKSYEIKLRKPENVLSIITSKGKRAINNALSDLTTKKQAFSGRCNDNMIILKVI